MRTRLGTLFNTQAYIFSKRLVKFKFEEMNKLNYALFGEVQNTSVKI